MTVIGMIRYMVLAILLVGCSGSDDAMMDPAAPGGVAPDTDAIVPSSIETFAAVDGLVCRHDGKPVIRLFSKTW